MEKIKEITSDKAKQIYNDLRSHYITHEYNYEQIFIDSGDYDDIDKNVLYEFVIPLLDLIDSGGSSAFEKHLEKLLINSKKPIYEIQIGEKSYIVNGKNMEVAMIKAGKENFGSVGLLIRGRKAQVKNNLVVKNGSWKYLSSKYIFRRKLKELKFPDF